MGRPRVVAIGAGFGGLSLVKRLHRAPAELLLLDRNNYHLFQPLLYQVAGAYLDTGDIARPVRSIIRAQANARFRMAEGTGRLLPDLLEDLAEAAVRILESKGVEVSLGWLIEDFDGQVIRFHGPPSLPAHTLIWTAGIESAALAHQPGLPRERGGRIRLTPALQVPGHPEVWVIGDAAYWELEGRPGPMVAPAAVQMAGAAAENILRSLASRPPVEFVYKNPGALATIGRNAAVAKVAGLKFKGLSAWLLWLVVHLMRLVGFRNRLVVLINWAWEYFFLERATRLILR